MTSTRNGRRSEEFAVLIGKLSSIGRSKGDLKMCDVEPEEMLAYFRNWPTCMYTGDPILVRKVKNKIRLVVGRDTHEVAWETQDFYQTQLEWDRFLRRRVR